MTHATETHPWERLGLGKAPFRYVGYEFKTYQACPGAPIQVGASCDACANGIKHVCWIEDAEGKRFKVGNVCVGKVDKIMAKKVDREVKAAKKAETKKREDARIEAAKELLATDEQIREDCSNHEHPMAWLAKKGLTRLDYFEWSFENAGQSGRMKIVRALDKIQKRLNG